MALLPVEKGTFIDEDIFKDTVALSKAQALQIQNDLIEAWVPVREVWALKYGGYSIGVACSITSLMVNSLFRRKLRLRYTGEILTTVALMAGPGVIAALAHDSYITENILLFKKECAICSEVKAGLLLNTSAILYPLILSPTINLALAGSSGLRIPYIYEVKEITKFWWSVVKPAINHLSIAFCMNTLFASVIVYKQFEAADTMANVIQKIKQYTDKN